MYLTYLIFLWLFLWMVGVASNPSPCYGAGALVIASGLGCGVLAEFGHFFVALVLFLVYLGGMLVVFTYSIALASDVYPEAWGGFAAGLSGVGYLLITLVVLVTGVVGVSFGEVGVSVCLLDFGCAGPVVLYVFGGWCLFFLGVCLLVTLFVVLELVRWDSFGCFMVYK